jgi:hypothetical protein
MSRITFLDSVRFIVIAFETQEPFIFDSASTFSFVASVSVSKRATAFWLAALRSRAFLPTTALIAGSLVKFSWSFTSSYPARRA